MKAIPWSRLLMFSMQEQPHQQKANLVMSASWNKHSNTKSTPMKSALHHQTSLCEEYKGMACLASRTRPWQACPLFLHP